MRNTKVLIVDDEQEFASALAERLEIRRYDAVAVFSVDEAFASIEKDPPDVVLLDLRMPGMSGLKALKRIKATHPDIEVIVLTGLATEQNRDEALRSGAFNYVTKPVEIDDLTVILDLARSNREQH